ncbi:MAG: murein biosynthesis integral membrane protein MurJ [Bryobacterales bacterium]|nr:murein biosynthesis integral membrane protein MurJ [Bryobacterales bacterium]
MNGVPPATPHDEVVRSAGVVSGAVLISRFTGLAREIAMARLFGAGVAKDAYEIGFRLPNLTRDLFAEGALSAAFVPVFTKVLAAKGRRDAQHLANLVATAILLVVGGFCLISMVISPLLVTLFAGQFRNVPGKFEMTVDLTRAMFPMLLLVALAAQAMGMLNAHGRFGVPALASTWFNIGSLLVGLGAGYWVAPQFGLDPIYGMAWGVTAGAALQFLWQAPSLVRLGYGFRPSLDWRNEGLRDILALMGPAVIGSAALQINVLISTHLAAGIRDASGQVMDGPVSWLGYAYRFLQLPMGLFGVAIGSATLPALSRAAGAGELVEFRGLLSRSLGMVLLLTVPSAVGLWVLGEPIVGLIYEGGRFTPHDTAQTASALAAYAAGLVGYSAVKVLTPGFYALGDARTPMYISFASIGVYGAFAFALTEPLGHVGLAVATSISATFSFAVKTWRMRSVLGGIDGRGLASSLLRICAAAAAMALVCWAADSAIQDRAGTTRLARALSLLVSIPLGVAVFGGACHLLRVRELRDTMRAVGAPLRRRFSRGR